MKNSILFIGKFFLVSIFILSFSISCSEDSEDQNTVVIKEIDFSSRNITRLDSYCYYTVNWVRGDDCAGLNVFSGQEICIACDDPSEECPNSGAGGKTIRIDGTDCTMNVSRLFVDCRPCDENNNPKFEWVRK